MDELFNLKSSEDSYSNFATVGGVYDDGLTLIFDGTSEATTKRYKCNSGVTFTAGDRVKICKDSGTYIVEYVVGNPTSGGSTGLTMESIWTYKSSTMVKQIVQLDMTQYKMIMIIAATDSSYESSTKPFVSYVFPVPPDNVTHYYKLTGTPTTASSATNYYRHFSLKNTQIYFEDYTSGSYCVPREIYGIK